MLVLEESPETGLFRHLSNHVFGFRNFGNPKAMRVIFFFQNVQNFIYISKMQQKILKKVFVSQIIASELASLNFPIKNRILFIGSQSVNKQSQDLPS